jgi:hypothetical protein
MSVVVRVLVDAGRRYARVRFWPLIIAGLVISQGGCASPTLEERLSYLELLKTRGTITDEEHAIMRRRLVETVDLAALRAAPPPAPPAEPQREPEPLSAGWVAGTWRGTHMGTGSAWQQENETVVEFSPLGDQLEWRMTRRFRYHQSSYVAEVAGTAVVLEDVLEMIGTYLQGRTIASDGTPIGYRLRRAGNSLEGLSSGADPLTRTLALHRVPAVAASVTPLEPGSLAGVWTGTLLVARRGQGDMVQDNAATLRIFAEASGGLRWTLASSYYGQELTGSGTVIVSADHVKLVGTYNVPAGGGGLHQAAATGVREIPIEYTARLSGHTLRGGGSGLDHVPQSFLFERAGR